MPALPDHWTSIEQQDDAHPFRLATSPARGFLNSTFNETPTSLANEKRPTVMIHPDDAAAHNIGDGDFVVLGNQRGEVRLHAKLFDGVRRGVLIAESIWPNSAYADGCGINSLTGADPIAPYGGAAFHDNKVWVRRLEELSRRRIVRAPCRSCGRPSRARRRAARWRTARCRSAARIRSRLCWRRSRARNALPGTRCRFRSASAAAKKRVNSPTMRQSAPTVSRNMAAKANAAAGCKPCFAI